MKGPGYLSGGGWTGLHGLCFLTLGNFYLTGMHERIVLRCGQVWVSEDTNQAKLSSGREPYSEENALQL
jgi:hypothetical protein